MQKQNIPPASRNLINILIIKLFKNQRKLLYRISAGFSRKNTQFSNITFHLLQTIRTVNRFTFLSFTSKNPSMDLKKMFIDRIRQS